MSFYKQEVVRVTHPGTFSTDMFGGSLWFIQSVSDQIFFS